MASQTRTHAGRRRLSHAARICLLTAALALGAVASRGSRAQSESGAGSTITLSISSSIGTGNDLYGRLMARHLPRFLPGHPNIVPENMPGAGGVVQANWVANVAKKD